MDVQLAGSKGLKDVPSIRGNPVKLWCILSRKCLGDTVFMMDASVLFQRFKALAWNDLCPDLLLKMGSARLFFFEALEL